MKVSLVGSKNLSSKHHLCCSNTSEVGWFNTQLFHTFNLQKVSEVGNLIFSTKIPPNFSDSKICRRYFLLEQHGVKCLCNRCAANFGMGGDVTQSKQNFWQPKFGWCFLVDMEAKCWCLLKQYQSSKTSLDLSWKLERASSIQGDLWNQDCYWRLNTLSPRIMVQCKITLNERKLVLEIHPFSTGHHDYGSKGTVAYRNNFCELNFLGDEFFYPENLTSRPPASTKIGPKPNWSWWVKYERNLNNLYGNPNVIFLPCIYTPSLSRKTQSLSECRLKYKMSTPPRSISAPAEYFWRHFPWLYQIPWWLYTPIPIMNRMIERWLTDIFLEGPATPLEAFKVKVGWPSWGSLL